MNEVKVEIVSGQWKKDKTKTWKGIKVTVGDWTHLIFPASRFETEYVEKALAENE